LVATFPQDSLRLDPAPRARASRRLRGGSEGLKLIQSSMSARRMERQAPWLAGLHRLSTGALVGIGLSMLGLSALTLHWQNRWATSYRDLEATKVLEHRLQESSAVLEQHHLGAVRRPGLLVPTSSVNLIHLSEPNASRRHTSAPLMAGLQLRRIPAGF
jgi:hypothetical protein